VQTRDHGRRTSRLLLRAHRKNTPIAASSYALLTNLPFIRGGSLF
jgi:hypothetical protein